MIKEIALILTVQDYERLVETFGKSGLEFTPDIVKTFRHDARDLVSLRWNIVLTNTDEYSLLKSFVRRLVNFDFLEIDPMSLEGRSGTFGLLEPTIRMP